MKRFVFLLVVVSGCFGTVFPAANAQPAESSSAPVRAGEDTSPETIEFSADRMSGSTGDRSDYTRLSGNARIATDTLEITADVIELSGTDFRYITASGNVSGIHHGEQLEFSCGTMEYDRTLKQAVFSDSVHLIDKENNVTADAGRIEYREDTGTALMQLNIKLVQNDSICTAAFAVYRKNQQMLELSGNPRVERGSDTFRAQEIQLNLKTDAITLDGRVSGSITDSGDKNAGGNK